MTMESVVSWNSFCLHFLRTKEQWCVKQLSAKRAQVERRQEDMAKRVVETRKRLESEKQKLRDFTNEKSNITAELAKRAADLQLQDAIECKPTIAEGMEVEQPPPENLTDDQKKFWNEMQAEATAAKRALQELAQSFTRRRCTAKTPPETIDLEPPDPTQGPSQASRGGNEDFPDVETLIAQSDREAALARETASRPFLEEVSQHTAKTQTVLSRAFRECKLFQPKALVFHSGPHGIRFARPCRDTPAQLES